MKDKNPEQIKRQDTLSIIRRIDQDLEGFQRRIKLYCVGGTYLSLTDSERITKDLDFILSRVRTSGH